MHVHKNEEKKAFVVIEKSRTRIWEGAFEEKSRPFVIWDPRSIPRSTLIEQPMPTSNYDNRDAAGAAKPTFHFLVGWMRPSLDLKYAERIYHHIKHFDHIYLVGGGYGWWSGGNNFISFMNKVHPKHGLLIEYQRFFRITDFPEKKLLKIAREMSAQEV